MLVGGLPEQPLLSHRSLRLLEVSLPPWFPIKRIRTTRTQPVQLPTNVIALGVFKYALLWIHVLVHYGKRLFEASHVDTLVSQIQADLCPDFAKWF